MCVAAAAAVVSLSGESSEIDFMRRFRRGPRLRWGL
jgi:hypothetical protein